MGSPHLDVGHEDHEQARDDQAGDDRPWDVAAWVLRLAAEGRGALEPDEREDAGDNRQAHASHVDATQLELLGVHREAVLEQDHEGQGRDARHGGALEDQGQDGGHADVLVGDQPAGRRADGEEDDRMDRAVVPQRREQLCAEHGEAAQARHGNEVVGPDQGPAGEHTRAGPESLGRCRRTWSPQRKTSSANWFRQKTTKSSMMVPKA